MENMESTVGKPGSSEVGESSVSENVELTATMSSVSNGDMHELPTPKMEEKPHENQIKSTKLQSSAFEGDIPYVQRNFLTTQLKKGQEGVSAFTSILTKTNSPRYIGGKKPIQEIPVPQIETSPTPELAFSNQATTNPTIPSRQKLLPFSHAPSSQATITSSTPTVPPSESPATSRSSAPATPPHNSAPAMPNSSTKHVYFHGKIPKWNPSSTPSMISETNKSVLPSKVHRSPTAQRPVSASGSMKSASKSKMMPCNVPGCSDCTSTTKSTPDSKFQFAKRSRYQTSSAARTPVGAYQIEENRKISLHSQLHSGKVKERETTKKRSIPKKDINSNYHEPTRRAPTSQSWFDSYDYWGYPGYGGAYAPRGYYPYHHYDMAYMPYHGYPPMYYPHAAPPTSRPSGEDYYSRQRARDYRGSGVWVLFQPHEPIDNDCETCLKKCVTNKSSCSECHDLRLEGPSVARGDLLVGRKASDPEALKLKKNLLETKKTLEAKQRIESNRDVRISNTALNKQEEVAPKARLQKAIPKAIEPKEFEVLLKEASTATQIKNINVKKGGQKRGPKKKLSVPGPVATAVARKKPGPKPGHKRRKVLPPKRFLESDVIEEDYIPVVSIGTTKAVKLTPEAKLSIRREIAIKSVKSLSSTGKREKNQLSTNNQKAKEINGLQTSCYLP
eukprot:m.37694 g.37694  ORF g.37694 m.37694 type:complete len:673 (-) comp9341_c0_seq1:526-2544(-)